MFSLKKSIAGNKIQLKTLVYLASNWEKCVEVYSSKSVIFIKFSDS